MLFRIIREDIIELTLGIAALASTISYNLYHSLFAQADVQVPSSIYEIIAQLGGFGIAVWLVIHHTMVTIPRMMKEHREERKEILEKFDATLKEKRSDYAKELDQQRQEFARMLEKVSCKYQNKG